MFVDGVQQFDWPVSTGKRGYSTPSGTFTPTSMNEIWYSKQWDNAPMPHAIFFMKDGHAIHGSYEVTHLGKPASHGCVRIAPQNATLLYELVKANGMENTQVVLSGETPGGESKVASSGKSGVPARLGQATLTTSPAQRGGFFRRLFGARSPCAGLGYRLRAINRPCAMFTGVRQFPQELHLGTQRAERASALKSRMRTAS